MVLKQGDQYSGSGVQFENDVKMYGTQAAYIASELLAEFENDVKMYGTQA